MQKMTFRGFLNYYIGNLSESGTYSVSKLVREAEQTNYRLREPLVLWCILNNKTDLLRKYSENTEIERVYHTFFDLTEDDIIRLLNGSQLPEDFRKVWSSYISYSNRHKADDETKEKMREKIIELQKSSHITTYRIYKDLGLNPGNFNNWIKNGKENLISLTTARRVIEYLEEKG